jgi:PIN domain nuclease of toxin-antitoxin system
LLDTHVLLWIFKDDPSLTLKTKKLVREAEQVFVSAATIWEIAIKHRIGKIKANPDELIEEMLVNGFEELPVFARHAKQAATLPLHHRDPFDRLLIAQAVSEHMRLLTADSQLRVYSDLVQCI